MGINLSPPSVIPESVAILPLIRFPQKRLPEPNHKPFRDAMFFQMSTFEIMFSIRARPQITQQRPEMDPAPEN